MKHVFRGMLPLRGAGIVVSLLAAGCVTSSDLAKLDQSMAQKLDAHAKAQRAEMGSLREQVKTLRTEAESLRAQVGALQLNTPAALETLKEQDVINEQALRDLSTITVSTKKEVEGYAAKAREHFGKIDHFPSLVSALGTEIRSLTETLRGNYELEEGGLRDRLRAVEELKKRLRPFEASQQAGPALQK